MDAVAEIGRLRPDLILLDVQMPGLDGFEVLRSLPAADPLPLVIFVTAYDQYALAAFDANAVGYLLKPVDRERFKLVIDRALLLSQRAIDANAERLRVRELAQRQVPQLQQVVARRKDRFVLLQLNQILFFRVEDGLLRARTETENFWTDYQINDLETRLPNPPFFRAHRSAIVNLQKVKEISPYMKSSYLLILNDREATEIQVSERQSKKLREQLWG